MAARVRDPEHTRRALLDAARAELVQHGFSATTTVAIVRRAGLTRGALYHHFDGLVELFAAVVEELLAEIDSSVRLATRRTRTPLGALRRGIHEYLRCCTRDDVRRIVLVDGPAALGWERWHELDARIAAGPTLAAVTAAMRAGEIATTPVEPLAAALLGMVTQAGLEIGRAPDPERRRRELSKAIDHVLDRLCVEPTTG